jgi:hypothetical protein
MPKLPDTVTGARVLGNRMVTLHRQENPEGRMPLMDHLRELRSRVIKAVLALLVGTAIGLIPWVFDRVWKFVVHPYTLARNDICTTPAGKPSCHGLDYSLIVNGIFDPFNLRIEVAFFFGRLVASSSGRSSPRGCTRGRSGGPTGSWARPFRCSPSAPCSPTW